MKELIILHALIYGLSGRYCAEKKWAKAPVLSEIISLFYHISLKYLIFALKMGHVYGLYRRKD